MNLLNIESKLIEILEKYEEQLKEEKKTLKYNQKCFQEFEESAEKWDYGRRIQYAYAIQENEIRVLFLENFIKDLKTLEN